MVPPEFAGPLQARPWRAPRHPGMTEALALYREPPGAPYLAFAFRERGSKAISAGAPAPALTLPGSLELRCPPTPPSRSPSILLCSQRLLCRMRIRTFLNTLYSSHCCDVKSSCKEQVAAALSAAPAPRVCGECAPEALHAARRRHGGRPPRGSAGAARSR